MPLGLSVGEFLATTGVVAVSFGAKEIPFLARSLGKLAGYAVGENYVPKVAPFFH
jgi:Sec-independent protein translocase protein TatA